MRQEARAALTHFASTVAAPAAQSSVTSPFALLFAPLFPAGDLTGNGRQAVLQTRLLRSRAAFTTSVTARDSLTGRDLWSRRPSSADTENFPLALTSTGNPRQPALLVAQIATKPLSATASRMSVTVAAWSGNTGKTLWTSTPVTGTEDIANGSTTLENFPSLPTAFHATGRPMDALITTTSFTVTSEAPRIAGAMATAVLISGADGASSSPYPALTSATDVPSFQAVGDLDGDGLDDVLALKPGAPGVMTGEHGDDGATIWSVAQTLNGNERAMTVGRVSRGRGDDLAIEGSGVSLMRGRDGKLLWTRSGAPEILSLGPVRPGQAAAVALLREFSSDSGSSSGGIRDSNGVDIRAVTATNRVAWHRRLVAAVRTSGSESGKHTTAVNLLDVQPDGTTDFAVRVTTSAGHNHSVVAGLVNGRNGKFRKADFGMPAAGSLVRGRGTDLL
jgi:hypothetical protein